MAFVSRILLFRYREWKATEVHNVMQVPTTCRYSCVGKTGTTQFLVYFLCKHNTFVYLLTVIISENHSCILRYEMFQVLKPYIFIKDDCPWSVKCSYHNIELKNSFRKVHKKLYILKRFCKPGLGYRKKWIVLSHLSWCYKQGDWEDALA